MRQRDNWGSLFRSAVASGRVVAFLMLVVSFVVILVTEGMAQTFAVVVGLFSLVAAYPNSPLIPAVVQWLPKLPKKGDE